MAGSVKGLLNKAARALNPAPAQAAARLRQMILDTRPEQIVAAPSETTPNVWGVLMEWWVKDTLVTLVSLADGTTSMYFSTGGGFIGAGGNAGPAEASRAFIRQAEQMHAGVPAVRSVQPPGTGSVGFHLLTFEGVRSTQMDERGVWDVSNPFRALRQAGEDVITQIRLHSEKTG